MGIIPIGEQVPENPWKHRAFGHFLFFKKRKKMYNKVYVKITNRCNMNCSFCHGHSRPLRQMSMEEFTLVLDRLAGHTRYIYYHLMGEPLTHPLLPAFI